MTNSFTNIFGATTIYPSEIGYIPYTLTQSTTLIWPDLGETSSSVAASFLRITASGSGIVLTTPDADNASVGKALRIKNVGATTFNVASASGSTLATISAGQDTLLSIIDNTTSGGLWDFTYLGSGTTSANAATLAGAGLSTSGATLITNWPVDFTGSNGYLLTTTSVGRVLTWTGGTGSIEIDLDAGTVRNGFFTAVKNNGSGTLTISGNIINGIDGAAGAAVSLYPNDSTFIVGAGTNKGFYTIGLTNNSSATGTLQVDVSNNATITLTAAQTSNKIFILTGTVAATGCAIVFPEVSGNFLIINQTLANGTPRASMGYATIRTSASGTSVRIPFNSSRSIVSDGTNIYYADDLTPQAPQPNLMYFSDFSKNPWQRGTSFTSSSVIQYTADRVSAVCASGAGFQITRSASTNTGGIYDLRIQRTSGAPAASGTTLYLGFDLSSSESIPLRSKNPTLAVEISTGSSAANLPSFVVYTSAGSNNKILTTLGSGWNIGAAISSPIVSSASGYYRFLINPAAYNSSTSLGNSFSQVSVLCQVDISATGANDYVNISRLSLVEDNFNEFDNQNSIEVQNKCQQFAYVYTASALVNAVGIGQVVTTTNAQVQVQFPSTMRSAPTLTVTASDFQVTDANAVGKACTSLAINTSGSTQYNATLLAGIATASLTPGDATILRAQTTTASMIFSADL